MIRYTMGTVDNENMGNWEQVMENQNKERLFKIATWATFYTATIVAASSAGLWDIKGYYAELTSPSFAPPNWLFGPVWTILYVFVATIGFRLVYMAKDAWKPLLIALWTLQFCLNTIWTPVFFGAYNLGAALIYIVALDVVVLAFIALIWNKDRISAYLAIPYLAWISFASILNASFWMLNG
ncbi:TspO/MBR family protein [uncultured Maritalea sp.]|uniref:TspO/MBR family protein n=2 Tax=Maritalea TaxID=623276 RepID=UPI00262D2691|nr:TspO/MBR family protein [uncultured Maritalea sp.]